MASVKMNVRHLANQLGDKVIIYLDPRNGVLMIWIRIFLKMPMTLRVFLNLVTFLESLIGLLIIHLNFLVGLILKVFSRTIVQTGLV